MSTATHQRPPLPRWHRIVTGVAFGVVLPIGCFAFTFEDGFGEGWQGGSSEVAAILISWRGAWPFYVLLAFSMWALMLQALGRATTPRRQVLARLGLAGGLILCLQYSVILCFRLGFREAGSGNVALVYLLANAATLAVALAHTWVVRRITNPRLRTVVFVTTVAATAVCGVLIDEVTEVLAIAGMFCAPALTAVVFFPRCREAWRDAETGRRAALPIRYVLGWLAAYQLAWGVSIRQTMTYYRSLPTQAPDCYVATVAARGHPKVVGSDSGAGGDHPVNAQLRLLKAFELAWRTIAPGSHASCRRAYDRLGPELARQLRSPWMADLAYLGLKPVELMALLCLRALLPDWRAEVASLLREADRARGRAT